MVLSMHWLYDTDPQKEHIVRSGINDLLFIPSNVHTIMAMILNNHPGMSAISLFINDASILQKVGTPYGCNTKLIM